MTKKPYYGIIALVIGVLIVLVLIFQLPTKQSTLLRDNLKISQMSQEEMRKLVSYQFKGKNQKELFSLVKQVTIEKNTATYESGSGPLLPTMMIYQGYLNDDKSLKIELDIVENQLPSMRIHIEQPVLDKLGFVYHNG